MNKAYSRINFQNAPSTATPLNATNLNKMDKAINDLDDRIIELSGYQEEAEESAEMASASASAAAKAAETATADAEARVNEVIQGLEVYTKADSHNKFASVIKQVATGSPILIKDGAGVEALDFKGKGRSTQNGTPTPDNPIAIKSVADGGYFDGELLSGYYNASGVFVDGANTTNVGSKKPIPCKGGDVIKIIYEESISAITVALYDENMMFIDRPYKLNTNEFVITAPSNAKYMNFHLSAEYIITPTNAKPITVTINGKYALIVKSKGKNLWEFGDQSFTSNSGTIYKMLKAGTYTLSALVTSSGTNTTLSTVYFNNGVKDIKGIPLQRNVRSSYTFTLDEDITKIILYAETDYSNSSGDTATWSDIQIEEGTTATPYEPYKETVTYLPLNEPLRSSLDGSVSDVVDLGERKVTRKYAEVVYNASSFMEANSYTNVKYFSLPKPSNSKAYEKNADYPVISDKFTFYEVGTLGHDNAKAVGAVNSMAHTLRYWFGFPVGTTLEEAQSIGDITLIYELAEPITETIEPVDIVTYDNVTYISNADNAEMEVTYATDTKSYIDSKFAELHAAIVNML